MADRRLQMLLGIIDQAYDRPSWHGTNLRGSLRGVSSRLAAWRPGPKRHNLWEIVVHAAYWKYVVRRRLTGERRGSFPLKGSNWFVRPPIQSREKEPAPAADTVWRADIRLLDEVHTSMRAALTTLDPRALDLTPAGAKVSTFAVISGIAAHDLYHAGQIQLLKRLAGRR